jgi:type II secretory pathway pseudopilin PulG
VIFGIAAAIVFSVPTGRDFEVKARASVCRSNLRDVSEAVSEYRRDNGEYPPAGRLDGDHPLIIDRYLDSPPRCPETDRYYLLESDEEGASVRCDSGLEGHEI